LPDAYLRRAYKKGFTQVKTYANPLGQSLGQELPPAEKVP
jgi:hypothetical protein